MKHQSTCELVTKRLKLVRLTEDDCDMMFDNWASDDEVTRYLTWPTHQSHLDTLNIINMWIQKYVQPDFYQWGIKLENGELIGTISVVRIDEAISEVEIGYCIGRSFWHHGYTSEALNEVIKFLFEQVKANRISAGHDTNNPNSGKVMAKCGMKLEGVLRQAARNNQGIVDMAVYSILKNEWFDLNK